MLCTRITGRRPLHVSSAVMDNSSCTDEYTFKSDSPKKKMKFKKYRHRNIELNKSPNRLKRHYGVKKSTKSVNERTDSITVIDDSGDEYVDCRCDIPQKPKQVKTNSSSKFNIHTIPSSGSEKEDETNDDVTISLVHMQDLTCTSPEKNNVRVQEPDSSSIVENPPTLPSTSQEHKSESEFMRTFKVLRDSFKESEEDDLIVVTKVHPGVYMSHWDIKQVVQSK